MPGETLTSAEAALALGVGTGGVRMLVQRDKLTPIRRGARPLRFHAQDVVALRRDRLTSAERTEIDDMYAEADAELASQVRGM